MDAYDVEVHNSIIEVMIMDVMPEDQFSSACMEALLVCGPPVEKDYTSVASANMANFQARNKWLTDMETLSRERFTLAEQNVGDFIVAFETWWTITQEDKQ